MSHALYNTMAPIGMMHAKEVARAVEALCMQACTHSAMAGAMVARGMTPSQAVHSVMAMEGTGATIPAQMMVPPGYVTQVGMAPPLGMAPHAGIAPTGVGISPQMAQQIAMWATVPRSMTPGMALSGNPSHMDATHD